MEDSIAEDVAAPAVDVVGVDDLEKLVADPEPVETETDPDAEEQETAEGEVEEQEEVEEELEIDIAGNKVKLPKSELTEELREKIVGYQKGMEGSLNKKSEDLSVKMKALEAREKVVQQFQTMQGEMLSEYSKGIALNDEIKKINKQLTDAGTTLDQLWTTDPDQARQFSDAISSRKEQINTIHQRLTQKEGELSVEQQKEHQRLFDEGKKALDSRIKGFSTKAEQVVDYVVNTYGMDRQHAETQWPMNPAAAEMAFKAMLFDQLQKKVKKKPAQKVVPTKPIKGTASRTVKDPGKLSPADYVKWRNKEKRGAG